MKKEIKLTALILALLLVIQPSIIRGEEIKVASQTVTLSVAGDATLGYYYGQSEWNRFDTVAKVKGYDYFLSGVKDIFEQDDLTILNLEGPLTTSSQKTQKEFSMKGLPEYASILTAGSVEAVNLANNHTLDAGQVGYAETKKSLEKANIAYFGEDKTHYTTANDIKLAIIGAKGWNNSKSAKNILEKRITLARQNAQLVIIMFHWGDEGKNYPNAIQKDLGRFAIDKGVDLVVASHPHVMQGIETYKGKNIVYSLSNFCFGANRNPSDKDTFIYQHTFALEEGEIVSVNSEVIPCSISSSTDKNDYRPRVLEGKDKDRVMSRLKKYSSGFENSYFDQQPTV